MNLQLARKKVVPFKSRNTWAWFFCVWAIVFFFEKAALIFSKLQLIGPEPETLTVNLLGFSFFFFFLFGS